MKVNKTCFLPYYYPGASGPDWHKPGVSSSEMGHSVPPGEHWKWRLLRLHCRKPQVPLLRWEENGQLWGLCPQVSAGGNEVLRICGKDASDWRNGRRGKVIFVFQSWMVLNVLDNMTASGLTHSCKTNRIPGCCYAGGFYSACCLSHTTREKVRND